MTKRSDIRPIRAELYFLPVTLRVPLKFGSEVTTSVTCARVCVTVEDRGGHRATGWGETPLAVQWAWPCALAYAERHKRMRAFCQTLTAAWSQQKTFGHPMELGYTFQREQLGVLLAEESQSHTEAMPHLAGLICLSAFDLALHDAFGNLLCISTYDTYTPELMNHDLAWFIAPAADTNVSFAGQYPQQYLVTPPRQLAAWHLVGGLDPLEAIDLTGDEPQDGYPVTLVDWIARDGLTCLKIKLRGNDADWDYARLVRVGEISLARGVEHLTADFNCTVSDPAYVNEALDRLRHEYPAIYERLLYVEQPFPYDLDAHPIDVRGVSSRKPLFLDESAHDWRYVRRGRELGWSGVALKTCKTQTGAILSLCWAKAHGMPLMVQDLTNPMLAQIPHVQLAAHAGTIMGVETNAMQFYPETSLPEAAVHPGLYRRRNGQLDLSTLGATGFGYRLDSIQRILPQAACDVADTLRVPSRSDSNLRRT
jgi:L-alanine-DL-glutamate epimerase-like enolase superfamily enzyme